ncbi:MAG: phosphoserine phosphatase [Planctomycetota bacterium]
MTEARCLGPDESPDDSPPPYDVIVFDCDSTLADLEGIDWLARDLGAEDLAKIESMTTDAMSGAMELEEVYGARLELIAPRREAMDELGAEYVRRMLPGAPLLVDALHFLGKQVHIVSGGLEPGVLAIAAALGIDASRVHAVGIRFDEAGAYQGFDESSPLARRGGKPVVLAGIARPLPGPDAQAPDPGPVDLPRTAQTLDIAGITDSAVAAETMDPLDPASRLRICLIGDGLTDLEAAPECARFVAFGGVVRRAAVFDRAAVPCEDRDLVALIPLLTSSEERTCLAGAAPFVDLF